MSFANVKTDWVGLAAKANTLRTWYFNTQTRYLYLNGGFNAPIIRHALIHETDHNMGFSHAGGRSRYSLINGFGDENNYMGNGDWYQSISSRMYKYIVCSGNPQPWHWFKLEEVGTYTVRLYAYDHPYSRHFFGPTTPCHTNDEVFDGIKMKYTTMSLEIPFAMVSQLDMNGFRYMSTMLDYRYNEYGQHTWPARSLRWLWNTMEV